MINIGDLTFTMQLQSMTYCGSNLFRILSAGFSLFIMAILLICSSGYSYATQSLHPAEKQSNDTVTLNGSTLLETKCSVCHSADKPKQKKMPPDQWEKTVNRMIEKGAKLSEEEKAVLLDYLSKTYGEGF